MASTWDSTMLAKASGWLTSTYPMVIRRRSIPARERSFFITLTRYQEWSTP